MLTFLHLSDIHFSRKKNDGSQFDLDQQIRKAMIADIASKPADGASYDGLLITGDIAYGGTRPDYEIAKQFLSELFAKSGLSMKQTYVVPGNHDVDRNRVHPTFPLWASHADIRRVATSAHWRETLQTQLQKDPSKLLLSTFHGFNEFAQACECQSTADSLAWNQLFPRPLGHGFQLRLHGVNSALISDAGDEPAKLLISEFQTSKLQDTPGEINLVLSHHPPDWLMDKAEIRRAFRRFAPIVLFGHEHTFRLETDDRQIQLFAGALQPERDSADWLPTYHVLQLSVVLEQSSLKLRARIHTREFKNYGFHPWRNEDGELVTDRRVSIRPEVLAGVNPEMKAGTLTLSCAQEIPQLTKQMILTDAKRELRDRFFQLRTPQRYEAAFSANLLKDGDDSLDPQTMWAEVFRRAEEEAKFASFWDAVSKLSPEMQKMENPFGGGNAQTNN